MASSSSIEQIIADYVTAIEQKQQVDRTRILDDHPQFANELQDFFKIHDQFELAADTAKQHQTEKGTASSLSSISGAGKLSQENSLTLGPTKEFGDYEILEEIDRGGMGIVYKARHRELGRIVALKVIRSGELASEDEVLRFHSEAEAAAALNHPGIVPIYEVGQRDGLVYYTMAYIQGQNLAELIKRGPLNPQESARIVAKLCQAVHCAHRAGVYHRDIKPANVLIDLSGQPILIDFGLAKMAHRDSELTNTGQILGTPAYMAPEHASGRSRELRPTSDVYSLGAILYFLCAGQPAFSGPTPFDVLLQVLDRQPPVPSRFNRKVSHELDHVCSRCLEKDPKKRYVTAQQLGRDLQCILQGSPIECARPSLFTRAESWWRRAPILVVHVCGIGLTLAIVAGWHYWQGLVSDQFPIRIFLMVSWLVACYVLQSWVFRARWRDAACLTWATIDVVVYTTLIAFAEPPRSMLLIGYPMLIVASSLFYRHRFILFMTTLCIGGFLMLSLLAPMDDFVKPDFAAIFVCGLIVISMTLLSTVRRVRSMSVFYDESPHGESPHGESLHD